MSAPAASLLAPTPDSVARILFGELQNNVGPQGGEWPTRARGIHLVPGIVHYEAVQNEDGSIKTPALTYLLTQEAIDRGRETAAGKPIVGRSGGYDHIPGITAERAASETFDGDAWESRSEEGKEWVYFLLKDPETKDRCRGGYKLSCAYFPTEVDDTPGTFAGVKYDAVIKNLRYTHFAIVPVPRYDFSKTGKDGTEGEIELLNSQKGGFVNETLKKLVVGLLGVKGLRELTNAAEMDEKATAKEKAKSAFDEEMKNAGEDPAKKDAATQRYNAAMAAADKPGAADDAAKAHAERQNRAKMLRNAADALDAVYPDKSKSMEHRNEADRLEKIPLGGGDVVPDPGVVQAGGMGATAAPAGPLAAGDDAAKMALEKKNAEDAAAKKKMDDEKAALMAAEDEKRNMAEAGEAWNSFEVDMVDAATAEKVALIGGRIAPFASQVPEVQNAWKAAWVGAKGTTPVERCNSLKAVAAEVAKKRGEVAAAEARKTEHFNALHEAAERRGGATSIPALGMFSDKDGFELGAAIYG